MNIVWYSEVKWNYLRTRNQNLLTHFPLNDRIVFFQPFSFVKGNYFFPRKEGNIYYLTLPTYRKSHFKIIEKHITLNRRTKGIDYYLIDSTLAFKLVLPLILLANISVLFSFYNLVVYSSVKWSIIFYCKLFADLILTYPFFKKISYSWNFASILLLSFIHPLYITLFAISAPFVEYKWKQ